MIPIYEPYLPARCLKYAHDALDSTWISSSGVYLDKAKELLKEATRSKFAILVNNGTSATHLVAMGLRYRHPTVRRLLVPNNVYVAAWNSFVHEKYHDLVPVDASLNTWNMDPGRITGAGEGTAILAVHNLGNVVNVPELQKRHPGTVVVEDACEALFGTYNGAAAGTASLAASFSFYGNKTVTSGEGGAVLTQDEDLFLYLNSVRGQGLSHQRYLHDKLGFNYRMTNVQAAILCGQLEMAGEIRERKDAIFDAYANELRSVDGVRFQEAEAGTVHARWMFAVRFEGFTLRQKRELELFLYENAIETRPMFYPVNAHAHLAHLEGDMTVATTLHHQCLMLPSFPGLTRGQVKLICNAVKKFLKLAGRQAAGGNP